MTEGLAAVGDVLAGKYRVEKILGIGGMGMVVAAMHLELDQRVALKFMLPGAAESPENAARFLREARAAGRLNSDHVCRMVDLGRFESGAPYIVMEYLEGESLSAVLRRRGPLRVSEAVDYILQAIEGLAEAHAHGIVHRDLKPDNLFLHQRNDGGTILKVLDFGISKISVTGVATKTGDIMGSPAYMAPEQMESSRSVDQRADLWSLGVVLYQLVAGQAPFRGDTLPLLCMHVVNDEPPAMSEIRGDLPDGFEAVVMTCLRKEPGARYADVGELAHALAPFGPAHASTSASRIQIVLGRARTLDSGPVMASVGEDDAVPPVPLPDGSLSASYGQAMAPRPASRAQARSWGVVGAVLAGLCIGAIVVGVLWRSGWFGAGEPAAAPASVAAPAPARPPAPIVEPIEPAVAAAPAKAPADQAAVPAPATDDAEPAAAPAAAPIASPPGALGPSDRKRRKPHHPVQAGRGGAAGSPAAASPGSAAGSDDDDKWSHMTHDEQRP